jgi:UDP-glucose 4-epimerase
MRALVTGGAGFIGSHLVDELIRRGHSVTVFDNFSTGFLRHLKSSVETGRVVIEHGDLLDAGSVNNVMNGIDMAFHLAANADVRGGPQDTRIDLEQNLLGTVNVLEAMRLHGVDRIAFTSSATVYGEPDVFPTPESYAGIQTSVYGASKLAAESYIEAYAEYFGFRCHIFRFVSWIGERYSHGVIYDFMNKLMRNPDELEILGDGTQRKSYLHVSDGVQGVFAAIEGLTGRKNIVNLGHEEHISVVDLARIVCDEMGLGKTRFRFTGGERGWPGDSPFVSLDVSRAKAAGFVPRVGIEEGIRRTVRWLRENPWILKARLRA